MSINESSGIIGIKTGCGLCLNEIRKTMAANLERSPLIRSYGYEPAGDRPTLFARFSPSFVPFMKFAG